ncbi:Cyclin-dependent kinase [Dirofilaria immitis]
MKCMPQFAVQTYAISIRANPLNSRLGSKDIVGSESDLYPGLQENYACPNCLLYVLRMASSLSNSWSNYYIWISKITEGAFISVYQAVDKRTGNMVTIKEIQFVGGIPSTLIQEITLLKSLQHPNIIHLEDVVIADNQLHLIFEFISMNLKTYINKIPANKLMDRAQQKSYLYQLLQAICYCHERNVLHRDLKPEHILIDQNGALKLADFTFDEIINKPEIYLTQIFPLFYKAPEFLLGRTHYVSANDMWSIGCIAAEIATKQILFAGSSNIDQVLHIFSVLSTPNEETWHALTDLPNYLPALPNWTNNRLFELLSGFMDISGINVVQQMLIYDPAQRISAKELLQDPYFADVDRTMLPASDYDSTFVLPPDHD